MNLEKKNFEPNFFERIVDFIIRLSVLFLLITACYTILKPFLLILLWSVVIAVAIYPFFLRLSKVMNQRKKLVIFLLVGIMLSTIIIPSILITESFFKGITHIQTMYQTGEHLIPSPGKITENWPKFTQPFINFWQSASNDLQSTVLSYPNQFKQLGIWALNAFTGISKEIFQFVVSTIIAGIILAYSEQSKSISTAIFTKLAGKNGYHFASITVKTIRNVVKGFLGVAIIQAILAGIGFYIAGVPFGGLWTVICLILAVIQVGIAPVVIPVIIYSFSVYDSTVSVILTIWLLITLLLDNVLKSILLGKNSPVPMPIVFLGAIGGFMSNGFLGLFLGAIILTIGYKLFLIWLYDYKGID